MGLDELVRYSVRREFYQDPREPFGVRRSAFSVRRSAFTGRGSQLAVSGFTPGA
jgi:hypothetical protein